MHRTDEKGTQMTRLRVSGKKPSFATGFFATLRAFLRGYGSGASSSLRTRLALASLLATLGALALAAAPSLAARGHVFEGKTIGSKGSGPGQFEEPSGVAVNEATGYVYVIDTKNNRVEYFSAAGKFEHQFNGTEIDGLPAGLGKEAPAKFSFPAGEPEAETSGIAIDNSKDPADPSKGDVYVADVGNKTIDKFTATGQYIGQITGTPEIGNFRGLDGVAVDTHGELWTSEETELYHDGVDNFDNASVNKFISFRNTTTAKGPVKAGLAVDSRDDLYVHNGFYSITNYIAEYSGTEVTTVSGPIIYGKILNEAVDGEPPSGVAVELSSDDVYVDNVGTVARFDAKGHELERLVVPGGRGGGVAVSSSAQTLYVADAVAGVVVVGSPEPPGPPTVQAGGGSVSDVTATSAVFAAEVNPRSELGEESTSYRFEYGPCVGGTGSCASSPYEQSAPVPEGRLASNYVVDTVTARPEDLQPHTVYHFRVVAHNSHAGTPGHPGVAEGEELVFTTQATGVFSLPDGRVWELVSPPDKHGALVGGGAGLQASVGGDAITYLASSPTEAQPPGNGSGVQVLSTRGGGGSSWSSRDIGPPHEVASGVGPGIGNEYRFFSEDLSFGVLQPFGAFVPSLSGEASEQTVFLRSDFPAGDSGEPCVHSCYRPLVTGAAGFANVPPGIEFGEASQCHGVICGPYFESASSDLSHIVLSSKFGLTEGSSGGLYEWTAGKLTSVGSGQIGSGGGSGANFLRHTVSDDGSRILFVGGSEGLEGFLMRDTVTSSTVKLDAVQGGSGQGTASPVFQGASSDGSRVFFTDEQRLTANSGVVDGKPDLYECEIVEVAGKHECKLTDLTPLGPGNESGDVRGRVTGVSEDGSYVYFVANGVLAAGAQPGTCEGSGSPPPAGATCNLYVFHNGTIGLVAILSAGDDNAWGGTGHDPRNVTARVSPDGRWLAFMSQRSLTGYDNRDALSGKPDLEVFLYDAEPGSGARALVCASCNPTGARPHGIEAPSGFLKSNAWVAAEVPAWTQVKDHTELYQSRYLSDSGRLFFNSYDTLVPQDTNGTVDVYQYEPSGVGDCTSASPTLGVASGGCAGLISSGSSFEESVFLDASGSGNDVFFLTLAKLSSRDFDTSIDVYDARVGGGEPLPQPLPACEGDACQSPVQAPNDQTPGSLTYQGPGNPAPSPSVTTKKTSKKTLRCAKGKKPTHGKCVKSKKKKARKARRASREGRTKS
jgi:hypothetical protein